MLTAMVRANPVWSLSWTKTSLQRTLCSSRKLFAMQEVTAKMQDNTIDEQKAGDPAKRGKKKEDKFILKVPKVSKAMHDIDLGIDNAGAWENPFPHEVISS